MPSRPVGGSGGTVAGNLPEIAAPLNSPISSSGGVKHNEGPTCGSHAGSIGTRKPLGSHSRSVATHRKGQ